MTESVTPRRAGEDRPLVDPETGETAPLSPFIEATTLQPRAEWPEWAAYERGLREPDDAA